MRNTKKTRKTLTVTDDIVCNRCGKSCMIPIGKYGNKNPCSVHAVGEGCYSSTVFADMHRYRFDLCEACVVKTSREWKHPPEVTFCGMLGCSDAPPEVTWNETVSKFYKSWKGT